MKEKDYKELQGQRDEAVKERDTYNKYIYIFIPASGCLGRSKCTALSGGL
jgi:hypothetical protein